MIEPLDGMKLYYIRRYNRAILNLVIDGLTAKDLSVYTVVSGRAIKMHPDVLSDIESGVAKSGWYFIYVISGERVLPASAEHGKAHTIYPIMRTPSAHPHIKSTLSYFTHQFSVDVRKYYKLYSPDSNLNPSFVRYFINQQSNCVIHAIGKNGEDLLENLSNELKRSSSPPVVNQESLMKALKSFYLSPVDVLLAFDHKSQFDLSVLPTGSHIRSHTDDYRRAIDMITSTDSNMSLINLHMHLPPMLIDEYKKWITLAEIMCYPAVRQRKAVLNKNTHTDDLVFEKLASILPDGTHEKYLTCTYGDLIDAGEVFTLGELYTLFRRFVWLDT